MLRLAAKFLAILNSEANPGQISLAFCFAMTAGLTPLFSLHNLLVMLLILILRVNLSAFIVGLLFFTGGAYLLDPVFHAIGLAVLTSDSLQTFWTGLYNNAFWRITNFNNTLLMGSLLFSIATFVPFYFFSNLLINKYRDYILETVRKSKLMQAFRASKFYSIYEKVNQIRGGG